MIFKAKRMTFSDLLQVAGQAGSDQFLGTDGVLNHLQFDSSPSQLRRGGFKIAYFGSMKFPLFHEATENSDQRQSIPEPVCAKQAFYHHPQNTSNIPGQRTDSTIIPYLGPAAITRMIMELRCLVWAQALLDVVYDLISAFDLKNGGSPHDLNRPLFQFVAASLAIEQGKEKRETQAFLIEELISEPHEGRFRKYLNNASPIPCQFPGNNLENLERAEFLAFTQHVQYWKTNKLVFVADYQGEDFPVHAQCSTVHLLYHSNSGGNSLLTDPQIITHPTYVSIYLNM